MKLAALFGLILFATTANAADPDTLLAGHRDQCQRHLKPTPPGQTSPGYLPGWEFCSNVEQMWKQRGKSDDAAAASAAQNEFLKLQRGQH